MFAEESVDLCVRVSYVEREKPADMRSKQALQAAIHEQGRAVLVVNIRSRRGRRLFGEARGLLRRAGIDFIKIFPVSDPARLPAIFEMALELRPDLVVVGGGDGTMAEAVSHLARRDVALGVLPMGTTNNFARSLHLPVNLAGAVDILKNGKVADVDAGWVAGRVFGNMVSIGLSVQVSQHVPHGLKRVLGRAAYGVTAIRLLARHRAFRARITIGDKKYEISTHQLNIANGSHHSGRPFARDATLDDRLLAIYRLGDERRLRLASATLRLVLTGHRRTVSEDAFLLTDKVEVETDPPLPIDVDGEIRGRTPVTISLLPNALHVLVDQDFEDT